MIVPLKKITMIIVTVFFVCFNICAMDVKSDQIPAHYYESSFYASTGDDTANVAQTTTDTSTSKETYTSDTIGCGGYDMKIEKVVDEQTGDTYSSVSYIAHEGCSLPDNLDSAMKGIDPLEGRYNSSSMDANNDNEKSFFDLRLPDCGDDVPDRLGQSNAHDHFQDHLYDSAVDAHRQELADNQSSQGISRRTSNEYVSGKRLVRELNLPRGASLNLKDMEYIVLDSDLILKNVNTVDRLAHVLSSPTIKARFRREGYNIAYRTRDRHDMRSRELHFFDALQFGKVESLLRITKHADLAKAEAAFAELTKLWPYQRDYSFMIHSCSSKGERQFIERIGVDIMKIAERDLITRLDYIVAHADEQSLKVVQEYKDHCVSLQKSGEIFTLIAENRQLDLELQKKGKKSNFADAACLALVENACLNPVAQVLGLIKNDLSIEGAHKKLLSFEEQIFKQAQQKNMHQIRDWTVKHYGFDAIEAARRCYISRSDYDHTAQSYVIVSDELTVMLNIIENKDLHAAHKELVHLEKQINNAYVSLDLTDEAAQKERLVQSFGIDAIIVLRDTYKKLL